MKVRNKRLGWFPPKQNKVFVYLKGDVKGPDSCSDHGKLRHLKINEGMMMLEQIQTGLHCYLFLEKSASSDVKKPQAGRVLKIPWHRSKVEVPTAS